MVVFGAGASYDSIDVKLPNTNNPGWVIDEEFRPPLAKDLFGFRGLFTEAMALFEKLQPIVPILRHTGGRNVETVLRELQEQAVVYPERLRQLMAVRYYLHYVLWRCEGEWKKAARQVTNYKALLDQINRWRKPDSPICLVTFNYDTLLEDAMSVVGPRISRLADYVYGNPAFKVFKLHGSVNWGRKVKGQLPAGADAWWIARNHIDRAAELEITEEFVQSDEHPCGGWQGAGLVPAIAIPVEKKASFECPEEHRLELVRLLPRVDRLVLIGWRATEDHFLSLLQQYLKGPILGQIVVGSEAEAKAIGDSFNHGPFSGVQIDWEYTPSGFTDFIVNRRAEGILSRPGTS